MLWFDSGLMIVQLVLLFFSIILPPQRLCLMGSLLRYPERAYNNSTQSKASTYDASVPKRKTFKMEKFKLGSPPACLHSVAGAPITGEITLASAIRTQIEEIVRSAPENFQANFIEIFQEVWAGGKYPDHCVVRNRSGHPIFVVAVKKRGIFDDKTNLKFIYGQLFESLLNLKRLDGVATPYGMLSTYDQFCICWIDDDTNIGDRHINITRVFDVFSDTESSDHKIVQTILTAIWKGDTSRLDAPLKEDSNVSSHYSYLNETKSMTLRLVY